FEMLNAELEGNQDLANSRMAELEKLQQELQQAVRGHERLKVALRSLPEEAVKETLEYKVLQSQFSLLYNESLQVKTQLDEARALLLATKNSHLRHIEHMESDELNLQKKLRTEVIQLEDTLAQVRKEYEMLRIEFEQNLAANEQAGERPPVPLSPPPGWYRPLSPPAGVVQPSSTPFWGGMVLCYPLLGWYNPTVPLSGV
ncbi:E3 ubiquitin-protein ligase BRE1B-like, partial [Apteryx rowi]|uniref:E3 ubiquitin-protein ligase BRE1B-like n=1 Tax=Apteryx rowi TaxID=308060 RepID=UPI000E1DF9D5